MIMTRPPAMKKEGVSGHDDGFTLVEVLVSFLILSLSLGFLYQSFVTSSRGLTRVRELEQAAALAETLLARIGNDIPLAVGAREGTFDLEGFSWRTRVSTSDLVEGQDRIRRGLYPYEVEAEVIGGKKAQPLVQLRTLRLGRK